MAISDFKSKRRVSNDAQSKINTFESSGKMHKSLSNQIALVLHKPKNSRTHNSTALNSHEGIYSYTKPNHMAAVNSHLIASGHITP